MFPHRLQRKPKMTLRVASSSQSTPELFDYDNPAQEEVHVITTSSRIYSKILETQQGSQKHKIINLQQASTGNIPSIDYSLLFNLQLLPTNNGTFLLNEPESDETRNNLKNVYISLRKYHRPYTIEVGDVIKFGRIAFKVLGSCSNSLGSSGEQWSCDSLNKVYYQEETFEGSCRICLNDDNQPDNALIAPCMCRGSCRLVHLQCLKTWIQSKVIREQSSSVKILNFTRFECQICKQPLPNTVKINSTNSSLLVLDRPIAPYLLLTRHTQTDSVSKIIYMLSPPVNKTLTVGRGNENQLRIYDPSVSRSHAIISYDRHRGFTLRDCKSKFGTLVLWRKQMPIEKNLELQIQNRLFSFQVQANIHSKAYVYL